MVICVMPSLSVSVKGTVLEEDSQWEEMSHFQK